MRTTREPFDLAQLTCTAHHFIYVAIHRTMPCHAMPRRHSDIAIYFASENDFQCVYFWCLSDLLRCVLQQHLNSLYNILSFFMQHSFRNELCSNNKNRNSAQYTKYNAFQHKQNFSTIFLYSTIFLFRSVFTEWKLSEQFAMVFFFLHSPWKWTTIRYHSFLSFLIFVLLFMFSFSVRTNVSCVVLVFSLSFLFIRKRENLFLFSNF